jgi:DNA-binding response OmpR family regulator
MDKKTPITVALIEDDQMLSEMYSIKFTKEGFRIVTAMNGADGLALIEKENPQIVLLDIIMPKMDGFQVLKELRGKGIKTPVIMLTNLGQEEDIQKGKQLGATDYFVKSNFTPEAIVHKVRHVLGQS